MKLFSQTIDIRSMASQIVENIKEDYEEVEIDGEFYMIIRTFEKFNDFCLEGGWGDFKEFESQTGVSYKDLLNVPFNIFHGRVYTAW